jgi:hypothetical protein
LATARSGETTDWFAVEVGLPARELSRGLVLIDTPGVGGVVASHRASTLGMVDDADAVLFATDAAGELTAPELEMIVAIGRRCPELVVVVTKTDLYPAWRDMVERNVGHLRCAGVEAPVIAVSSALRSVAVARADQDLSNESGFGDLARVLRARVLDASEQRRLRRIHRVLASVVEDLVEAFTIERMALGDADALDEVAAEAAASAARSEAALDRSARWQVLLNDGMKDLVSDVEHDLRRGFRALTESADERIDQLDPRRDWDDFAAWLHGSVEEVVLGNQRLLADRVEALARDVEHVFVVDGEAPMTPTFAVGSDDSFGGSMGTDPTFEAAGVLRSVLGGLRGSYSGLLMFGALGGLAGVAVATPVLVGIGLLLGARQVGDERERQLKAHRQRALVATKRTIDGVSFSVNKATRDHTNAAQRLLRDHYTQRAADLREAAKLMQVEIRRLRADRDERASRAAALGAELRRLDELRRRIDGSVSPSS